MKGQVTLFVIIGAILLLSVGLIFYISTELSEDKPSIDIPDVSLEVRPARELVDACLEDTAIRGLRQLGASGGLLNAPLTSPLPYESSSVDFTPYTVPYWRYLDDTNCPSPYGCEKSEQPPLCKRSSDGRCDPSIKRGDNSIEEQLETYIEQNIESCIDNFGVLQDRYDISILQKPDISLFFTQEDTRVVMNYPVQVKSLTTDNVETIEDFTVNLDVDLLGMYKFADEIVSFIRQSNIYETQTMNLINIYAEVDGAFPPTSELQFFVGQSNTWIRQDLEDMARYDVLPLVALTNYVEAKNFRQLYDYTDYGEYSQYAQAIYNSFTVPLNSESNGEFNVYHNYLYEPIFFEVNNGREIIRPAELETAGGVINQLISLAVKDLRFKYHISYPILITINDDEALNGEGFDFTYAIEVNVKNNIPAYNNFTGITSSQATLASIGDFEQRLEHQITITTIDRLTRQPLEDVEVSYVCGDREYDVGVTEITAANKATVTTTLPYCIGGFIKYNLPNYYGQAVAYDNTEQSSDATFTFELWPLKEKEIILYRRSPVDMAAINNAGTGGIFAATSAFSNLSVNHTAFVNVEKIDATVYDTQVPTIPFVKFGDATPRETDYNDLEASIWQAYENGDLDEAARDDILDDLTTIKLQDANQAIEFIDGEFVAVDTITSRSSLDFVPGIFTIDASIIDYGGIFIPGEIREICNFGLETNIFDEVKDTVTGDEEKDICFSKTEIELPEQNITTWFDGGAKVNISLSEDFIYNQDLPIILYVLELENPTTWDELGNNPTLEEYQIGKEHLLVENVDIVN